MRFSLKRLIIIFAIIFFLIWSYKGTEFSIQKLISGIPFMSEFISQMFPPDARAIGPAWVSLIETIQIAFLGSLIGIFLALPPSFLAAKNLMPGWLSIPFRSLLTLIRTIPVLVWALFFVAAVGLGPFPGILATAMYTMGFIGKLFYESIESVEKGPVEAIQSTGAAQFHIWRYGIIPQVIPHFISFSLYIFEYNVRAATVLGFVGAGGVGYYLMHYMRSFQYSMAATVILITLLAIIIIDWVSLYLRKKII